MIKTVLAYSLALASSAFLLDWLEYRYMMRSFSTETFIIVIAFAFTALGAWTAWKLLPTSENPSESGVAQPPGSPRPPGTECQSPAHQLDAGLTQREAEVLDHLARGCTNKEIAKELGLAPDTVKTHLSNIYRKLNVNRRTQAIRQAQSMLVIR